MRLRDQPIVEVTARFAVSPAQAWELVTDIELPTHTDGELQRVEWIDGADSVAVGARFRGHNANEIMGEWATESQVVEHEDGRRWVWAVGPVDEPFALWGFEVDAADSEGRTVVRQWAKVGPGQSPLTAFVQAHPDKEALIIDSRLGVWRDGMKANLAYLAEQLAS